ncbi:MAG TPA: DUF4352 domain-containing protein [Nitrosopumilus sp.]|nr:DUF4352 domain-containing protein [Thermoproteota archaeon]HJJ22681.1 DUF4352 domain-containing protein [Nitrosopumilus sp.]
MGQMGLVIVVGVIIATMIAGMYTYTQYQTNYITSVAGEVIIVGPVEYVITFDGTHDGNKETIPENMFVKIGITAKNISNEKTLLSGGQFYIIDEKEQKHEAVYGKFSSKDLLMEVLEPNKPIERTTQFDIPFDEEKQYKIIIRPQKEQATADTAVICITNC